MTSVAFDGLAQVLTTRRVVVRGGAALLPGAPQITSDVEAWRRKPRTKCRRNGTCCAGSRCRRERCRCKSGRETWADDCCKHRFAWQDDTPGLGDSDVPGTEFCCLAAAVCPQAGNPDNNDCCQESEACLDDECCCDGCRGTVMCGEVCCGSTSCGYDVCRDSSGVGAETEPGKLECMTGQVAGVSDAACSATESCLEDVCCSPDRIGSFMGEHCCGPDSFGEPEKKSCGPTGVGCTTGKKVRIRV